MLKVFSRPILVQVWQDIPDCLSDRIESVQKRALKIIYPNSSYRQALLLSNETTLAEMMDTRDHPLSYLVSTAVKSTNPYNLRPSSSSRPFNNFKRTKRSENFFTFKYIE